MVYSQQGSSSMTTMYKHSTLVFSVIVTLLCGGAAGIWPFSTLASAKPQPDHPSHKRIAIIGAGAAGASAAYHLSKFAKRDQVSVNITVFERSAYVGGRSTTINAYDDPSEPVELGASIFVEVNRILKGAADEFGLHKSPHGSGGDGPDLLGIWNGEKFVFTQKDGGWEWWQGAKLIWKYGLAPIRTQRLMQKTVEKFLKLYEPPFFPFRSLSDRSFDLDLTSVTSMTGQQFLLENNIAPPFTTDIIQASTRVNYGQNLGIIHGLETMVCMAINGAMQIEGGNWQIFSEMLIASGASVILNTSVTGLRKSKNGYTLQFDSIANPRSGDVTSEETFDTVILAAPLQFSGIKLEEDVVKHVPDEIPYVKLHVTLFTTPLKLNRGHFNLKEGEEVPTTILTTLSPDDDSSNRHHIVGKPGFFSISTLRTIINPKTLVKEYVYKIFSPEKVTEELLSSLFGIQGTQDISIFNTSSSGMISWYYTHEWHAYPYEFPRVTFDDPELARGFYYTSGIESFISTMETSALMGMNVAQLVIDDYLETMETVAVIQGHPAQKVGLNEL